MTSATLRAEPPHLGMADINVADAVARPRPARWLAAALVTAVSLALLVGILRNNNIEWPVVLDYLTYPSILHGLWTTVWLTAGSMILGTLGGTVLALGRNSSNLLLRAPADLYVWFFREPPC